MAKIYCHINQCDAGVQYFAILYADKYCMISEKSIKLKIHSMKNFSHTIKQLLHQYHKILALWNIKGELASLFSVIASIPQNIGFKQY